MDVKYTGRANYRIITTADMAAQGVEGWETTTWAKGETKTVQEAGGAWLTTSPKTSMEFIEILPAEPQTFSAKSKSSASTSSTDKASSSS